LFVQGEQTLDRSQGGLGVGLTIVRRLIEMHGGTITATSAGANRGATFEIRLPLIHDAQPAAAPTPAQKIRTRRILVVDDNVDGAEMLSGLLQLDGHIVETVLTGAEALERIPSFQPDLALLDIGLPGLDGYEVAHRIRANRGGEAIQLVAVTGYGREEDRERVRAAGFAAHLIKPIEFSTLQRVLAELAGERRT
jgi:CheY-like chemotaxis protein